MLVIPIVCLVSIAYLCGSLPFGYLVARVVLKDDIRNHGSGNIGATNVRRVLGNKWGALVLVLDALKGAAPVLLLPPLFYPADDLFLVNARVIAGITAVIGHMFPVWLQFRGGKGVATALGVVIVLNWQASVVALVVFLITVIVARIVSLGSILGATAFAIAHFILTGRDAMTAPQAGLTAFCLMVPTLIVVRHRANIARILRGEESRLGKPKSVAGASSQDNGT